MARCNQCGKLCSLETAEPEPEFSIDVDGDKAVVKCSVRLVRTSECCGDEVKEADFDLEQSVPAESLAGHVLDPKVKAALVAEATALQARLDEIKAKLSEHELEVEEGDAEATERYEGKGRGTKSFYGFTATYSVSCSCGDNTLHEGEFSDDIQASCMDELS